MDVHARCVARTTFGWIVRHDFSFAFDTTRHAATSAPLRWLQQSAFRFKP
jgi:hypothetical protein